MWKRFRQSRKVTCTQVRVQLPAYFDGELPSARQQVIRIHLATCEACAHYARDVKALEVDLAAGAARRVRGLTLSPQMSARVQERVYRRMRRAIIMQRVTKVAAGVAAVVAVVALAVGIFTVWQRESEETPSVYQGEPTVITFVCSDHQLDEFKSLARDFEEANPDIRMQFISADEASGVQRQGNTVISDGRETERLTAAADTFIEYGVLGPTDWTFLLDLTPFANGLSFPADDFYPGTLEPYRWKGGLFGIPASVIPYLIFYDKGMFDAAGVPYPKAGWTWEDLINTAARLTKRDGGTVRQYGFVDDNFIDTLLAMARHYGVRLWDDETDPPEPLFQSLEVTDLLRRYVDMVLRYEVMPAPELGGTTAHTLIHEGKAAIWTDAAYNRAYHAHRTKLGVAPFPEAVDAANPNRSYGFFISAGTAYPEAAWRWLSYLSANYQPPLEGILPGRRSVTERLPWWKKLDEETRAVYEYAMEHPLAVNNLFNWPLGYAARDVFEDGASVEEALAAAQERALGYQAELAAATPSTPQPVAPSRPMPQEGQTVITFAPDSGADFALYRKLADHFRESHPDIWVEIVPRPASLEELPTAADCFAGTMSLLPIPEFRQNVRSLQPLVNAHAAFDLSDFYPQFLAPLQYDGELWALPYEADTQMVYLNLERFAEAGVTPPESSWSFEEFLDAAVALSGDGQHGFTTHGGAYEDLEFALEGLGARLFDFSADPPKLTLDDASVVAALEQYATLSQGRDLTPATPSAQTGWPDTAMVGTHPAGVETGDVAMWIDRISYQDYAPSVPFETRVAPLPMEAQPNADLNVKAYYISAQAAEPQACWDWLAFLSSRPETVQFLPARRSVADSQEWQEWVGEAALPAYQATLEFADRSLDDQLWDISGLGYAAPWLDEAYQATMAGGDAELALRDAQAKVEAFATCLEATEGPYSSDQLLACARQVDPDYPAPDANR